MKLDELLRRDQEAAALFQCLPLQVQKKIRRSRVEFNSAAELREHTVHMVSHDGPFYANAVIDGTKLEPELKAEWTMEHQV